MSTMSPKRRAVLEALDVIVRKADEKDRQALAVAAEDYRQTYHVSARHWSPMLHDLWDVLEDQGVAPSDD